MLKLYAKWQSVFNLNFNITTDEVNPAKDVTIIVNNSDTLITDNNGFASIALPDQSTYEYIIEIDRKESSSGTGQIENSNVQINSSIVKAYMRWEDVIFCDNGLGIWSSFEWTKSGLMIGNEQFFHQPGGIKKGTYSLKVTTLSGKAYIWTKTFEDKKFSVSVYPNPVRPSENLHYDISTDSDIANYTLFIYNNSGTLVQKLNNLNSTNEVMMNQEFAPGIYRTVLTENDQMLSSQQFLVR